MERDALRRDKAHLTAKVKTLEWEAAQQARTAGGNAPGSTAEGAAEGPTAEKGGGAPNAAGTRFLLAGAQAWHVQAEAAARQMSDAATGLRMALPPSKAQVEVATVEPDLAKLTAAHDELAQQYPPPPPHGGGD